MKIGNREIGGNNPTYIKWMTESFGDNVYTFLATQRKFVILCGYTDTEYIIYDPASDQFERYTCNPKGYNRILNIAALKNK